MHYALPSKGDEAVADLGEQSEGLGLCELGVGLEVLLEVGVAEFLHDVVVVGTLHDIIDLDDVFGLEQLQDLNF